MEVRRNNGWRAPPINFAEADPDLGAILGMVRKHDGARVSPASSRREGMADSRDDQQI